MLNTKGTTKEEVEETNKKTHTHIYYHEIIGAQRKTSQYSMPSRFSVDRTTTVAIITIAMAINVHQADDPAEAIQYGLCQLSQTDGWRSGDRIRNQSPAILVAPSRHHKD